MSNGQPPSDPSSDPGESAGNSSTSSQSGDERRSKTDIIGIFARHRTAPNLLMVLLILLGVVALMRMNTQFFPDFGIDIVSVTVEWPGASAEDVDSNIVQALEPEVRFLDGVKRVRSFSYEGAAQILVEFEAGTDMQSALSNVQTAVGRVTTLPEDSEKSVIQRLIRYDTISRLIISGPYSEASLKAAAKRIRNELLRRGIDRVDIFGDRKEEIHVEIEPEVLRRLGVTLGDISTRIGQTSRDIPSGDTKGGNERQIRSLGLLKTAEGIAGVEIRSLANGQKIYLRDIATVRERFRDKDPVARFRGQPALELHIQRATNADALVLANIVQKYMGELRPTLPPNLEVIQYDIQARLIRSRINLLLKNGVGGLVLVVLVLFVFLNGRVAFWVAMGIPVSLMATMLVMLASGQTINMVSLFALIMTIGIIVDDAIVVGEHAETRWRGGLAPLPAAEAGARRMLAPVFSSSLTTIAAFLPLFLVSDIIGQIIVAMPMVVVAVIVASLVECFLVMPGHLREAFKHTGSKVWGFRRRFDAGFGHFRDRIFRRFLALCLEWRYATLALAIGTLIASAGLIQGGRIGFIFFPSPEVDKIYGNVEFAAGTPRATTIKMLDAMEQSLAKAESAVGYKPGTLVKTRIVKVGTAVGSSPLSITGGADHTGGIIVELVPSEDRSVTAAAFMAAWRKAIEPMPGLQSVTVKPAQAGPPGKDVDVRLMGADPEALKRVALRVRLLLARYTGVSNIEDDLPHGKFETIVTLTPRGKALGFTTEIVGGQIRNAFEGAIAKRFARGDEEVAIRVQYPRSRADQESLNTLYLKSPRGPWVPLSAVVRFDDKVGFARINRENGSRQVAVTAELDKALNSTDKIIAALKADGIDQLASRYGLTVRYAGKAEEQARTFGDMGLGALIGLAAIYIILAWVFSSYTRPIVVMSVIPLGFVGATIGHLIMGFDLTIMSMVALIGLSGIVVNDSIILVSTIDERIAKGQPVLEAIADGARDRLRAVILTSASTIGGVLPLIFETDLQAQFLIPMAVTLAFGLLVATVMVLVVVPALLAVQSDFGRFVERRRGRVGATPAE
ncbi:MAG: efflux RND transporter permease subunit [Alphaproteobacteria bacterium]|nr:efflux RND transporter permease subunit [Alphaproteobacteria bacterium]